MTRIGDFHHLHPLWKSSLEQVRVARRGEHVVAGLDHEDGGLTSTPPTVYGGLGDGARLNQQGGRVPSAQPVVGDGVGTREEGLADDRPADGVGQRREEDGPEGLLDVDLRGHAATGGEQQRPADTFRKTRGEGSGHPVPVGVSQDEDLRIRAGAHVVQDGGNVCGEVMEGDMGVRDGVAFSDSRRFDRQAAVAGGANLGDQLVEVTG